MTEDPWGDIGSRYSNSDRAQFVLFVEQYAATASMLREGGTTTLRIALVVADNLAEMLLHRQKEKVFRIAADDWRYAVPRYDRKGRERLRNDFSARVTLGGEGSEDSIVARVFRPLLDEKQQAIFRTAHAYRNRIYHADHHNPAVLPLITAAYLLAVGEAFVHFQPTGTASSPDRSLERLEDFGLRGGDGREGLRWPEWFAPEEAAREIVDHLSVGLEAPLEEIREALSADLLERAEWVDSIVADLKQDGCDRSRVEEGLRWDAYWREVLSNDAELDGLDKEFVELSKQTRQMVPRLESDRTAQEQRLAEVADRRAAIVLVGSRGYESDFGLGEVEPVRTAARKLLRARSASDLFQRYLRLDLQLEQLERSLDEFAIGWDRHLQEEEDRARGG